MTGGSLRLCFEPNDLLRAPAVRRLGDVILPATSYHLLRQSPRGKRLLEVDVQR
jgi:hypothetical protein